MLALSSSDSDLKQHERQLQLVTEDGMIPIIDDGSRIQYYSITNADWILGTLHVKKAFQNIKHFNQPRLSYWVTFPRMNKDREDVMVDCFRRPFSTAEPIDIFSQRDGGIWIPGFIDGEPRQCAVTVGYRVRIEHDNEEAILDNIPPWRLRRRFPPGCPVQVYQGLERGWVQAVVHSLAAADSSPPPLPPLGQTSPGGVHDSNAKCPNTSGYWMNVPIVEGPTFWGMKGKVIEDDPEWVPSYFVRLIQAGVDEPMSPFSAITI
jgi:hypothetical protein